MVLGNGEVANVLNPSGLVLLGHRNMAQKLYTEEIHNFEYSQS
jgi:hypothetical protein